MSSLGFVVMIFLTLLMRILSCFLTLGIGMLLNISMISHSSILIVCSVDPLVVDHLSFASMMRSGRSPIFSSSKPLYEWWFLHVLCRSLSALAASFRESLMGWLN